jgi:hypothetical protein
LIGVASDAREGSKHSNTFAKILNIGNLVNLGNVDSFFPGVKNIMDKELVAERNVIELALCCVGKRIFAGLAYLVVIGGIKSVLGFCQQGTPGEEQEE